MERSVATAASVSPSDFSSSPGDSEEDLLPRRRVVGPPGLEAQRLDQIADVAGLGVERLQRRRRGSGRREVVQIQIEDQLPGLDGGAPVVELPDVELRRAGQQVRASVDVGGVATEGQLLIDVDQLGVALERGAEPLDLDEGVGVLRIGRQHLPPGGERHGPRLQLVLLQIGDAGQQRRRGGPLLHLTLDLEDRRQARPGAAGLVDRLEDLGDALAMRRRRQQLFQQPAGPLVVGGRLDDPFQEVERAADVVEVAGAQVGAAELQLRHLALGSEADPGPEQRLQIGPSLAGGEEPLEGAVGAQVGRIELQHLLVRPQRLVGIGER